MLKRDEDKAPAKRWWNHATPWAQLALGIIPPFSAALYLGLTFFSQVKDAVAAIPQIQQQQISQQQQIVANKAATDQGIAILNIKMDMTMEYLGVPHKGEH